MLSFLEALRSAALEILAPENVMIPPGDTTVVLSSWKQQAEKGATLLVGLIGPNY